MERIQLGDFSIEVEQKDIKNLHLSVYPPEGRVRIAAPSKMKLDTIRIYAISKLSWIKKQKAKILSQKREAPREYLTKESHYYLGKRYLLKVIELDTVPVVNLTHNTLELYVRPGSTTEKRKEILDNWYREHLRKIVIELIAKWEKKMKLKVGDFGIKKPVECIEYIVVHELVHFKERNHNDKFVAYMNHFLPEWKQLKKELNRLPVSHIDWGY